MRVESQNRIREISERPANWEMPKAKVRFPGKWTAQTLMRPAPQRTLEPIFAGSGDLRTCAADYLAVDGPPRFYVAVTTILPFGAQAAPEIRRS